MYIPTDLKRALSQFESLWQTNPSYAQFLHNEFVESEKRDKRDIQFAEFLKFLQDKFEESEKRDALSNQIDKKDAQSNQSARRNTLSSNQSANRDHTDTQSNHTK